MSTRPQRKGKLVQPRTAQTWAVYESDSDSLHELNATARAIWELCDGETTPEEMADAISEVTGMNQHASIQEVQATLERLEASGLLVRGS